MDGIDVSIVRITALEYLGGISTQPPTTPNSSTNSSNVNPSAASSAIKDSVPRIEVQEVFFETYPYPEELRTELLDIFSSTTTPKLLCQVNFKIGQAFGEAILKAIHSAGLTPKDVDLIGTFIINQEVTYPALGSHGQTIWHDVVGTKVTSTLQIGESAVISQITGDFAPLSDC